MDNSLLVALVCAVVSTVVALCSLITDRLQWGVLRYIKAEFDTRAKQWEANGSVGEQLGEWILASKNPDEPCNGEVIGSIIGSSMAKSMRNAYAGEKSGDVRLQKGIDGKVFEAIQDANPEMKLIGTALDRLGLGDLNTPELLPYAAKALGKYVPKDLLGGQVTQNNGGGQSGW